MTTEDRVFIELVDIIEVEYRCRDCKTAVTVKRENWRAIPDECPKCRRVSPKNYLPWFPGGTTSTENQVINLLDSLEKLAQGAQDRKFDLRFRIARD